MVFTSLGKTELAKWFNSESANAPTHFAVGSSSTAPNITDSALGGEVLRDSFDSQSRASTLVSFEGVVLTTEATGSNLTEVGIFNSSSGGILFTRNTFAELSKSDAIELQIECRTTIQ